MLIFTICNKLNDNIIYIGSTKQSLTKRFIGHCTAFKQGRTLSLYDFIRENDDVFDNYYIELYKNFEGTLEELKKREGEIIREFKQKP